MTQPVVDKSTTPRIRWGVLYVSLLLLALACRALYLAEYSRLPLGSVITGADILEYDRWAREMVAHGILWDRVHIHAPLYPVFLSLAYRLTGFEVVLVRALQLCLDVVSLGLVSAAVAVLGFRRAALWTAGFWAVCQPLIYYSAEYYSEVLVVFWLSAALFLWALACCRAPRVRGALALWLGSVFCCGLAAITHPLSLSAALPFCAVGGWLAVGRRLQDRRALVAAGLAGVVAVALPIVPVAWRNAVVSGDLVLVQGNVGLNLYIGNNPEATGTCYVRPGPDYDALVNWPLREGYGTPGAANRFFLRRVGAFVASSPLRAGGLLLRKLLLTWNAIDIPSGADLLELQLQTRFMRVPLLRFGLLAPLACAGIAMRWRKRFLWAPAMLPMGCTLALGLLVTSGRYRLAMLPGLLILAGVGADALQQSWLGRRGRLAVVGLGAVLAGFALAFLPVAPPLPGSGTESALILAEAAWKQKRYDLAETTLAAAMAEAPDNAAIFHLAGNILADSGRSELAVEALEHALILDPHRGSAQVDLAIVLSGQGEAGAAREQLQQALEREPDNAQAWYNLALIQEQGGEPAAALAGYRRAAELDPLLGSALLNAAILEHRLGDPGAAIAFYQALLRLEPGRSKALTGLALALAELERRAEALPVFARALRADPEQPVIWRIYADCLLQEGREAEAAAARRQAGAVRLPEPPSGGGRDGAAGQPQAEGR